MHENEGKYIMHGCRYHQAHRSKLRLEELKLNQAGFSCVTCTSLFTSSICHVAENESPARQVRCCARNQVFVIPTPKMVLREAVTPSEIGNMARGMKQKLEGILQSPPASKEEMVFKSHPGMHVVAQSRRG